MSWSSCRALLVLTAVAALGMLSLAGLTHGQGKIGGRPPIGAPDAPPMPGGPPMKKEAFDLGNLTLPKNGEDLKERVEAASDNVKRKDWDRACKTLQELVGREEDVFVPLEKPDAEGNQRIVYVSVKTEAGRLIANLPKAGRDFYETTYGPRALDMVKAARTNNDPRAMGQAMSLYLHTNAGIDAASWLGTYYLDRAQFTHATRFYKQLVERAGLSELRPNTLLKAAYAFHAAGDRNAREAVLKELDKRGIDIKLRGDNARTVADVRDSLDKLVIAVSQLSASDSPIYRGRENRSALLAGGIAFMEPLWKRELARTDATKGYIRTSETLMQAKNAPILSGFSPVTATATRGDRKTQLLIYRSWWGIHAVNMKDGKTAWDSRSDWSLDNILGATGFARDASKVGAYSQFLSNSGTGFLQTHMRPQILLENSVLGTLSADSKHVYAVEDLAVPPPATAMGAPGFPGGGFPGGGVTTGFTKDVVDAINSNKLQAFSLAAGGKLVWEIGGDAKGPMADNHFLSAPLPLNGRLYVLCEKQQELRLVQIEPATGKVLSVQPLANLKNLRMTSDPLRRTQAAHLAYGEGILVVPTNAGAVFGVDLLANSLLWASPYRETAAAPAPPPVGVPGRPGFPRPGMTPVAVGSLNASWQVTAPVVADGKVVFTAPDDGRIHCVSLREGTRVWTSPPHDGDLYMAGVYGGKVLVVGRKSTRALDLHKGHKLWELETGEPSGQGAASNTGGDVMYYVPVRHSVSTKEPEIVAINVDKGFIHAHTRSRKKEVPGNLLFFEGNVLSQSHTEVVAYPQLEVQLAKLEKELVGDEDNAAKLTERGDYLLDKGDLANAITDFRKALRNKPDVPTTAKARGKLYEAFTEYFQRDFGKAETFLKEYEEMCKVDLAGSEGPERTARMAEERRRRANFLCLVGKGREAQNKLVEAFDRYLELGQEARPDELIQVVDEPSVKAAPDVWSQGRIKAMIENAGDAKQKEALEAKITERWEAIRKNAGTKTDDVRKFVSLFGSLFGVGRDARFALAERLMEDTDLNSLLEAEQNLTLLLSDQDQKVAARATEALARLNARKGLLEDAAFYYRTLGEKYPNVVVNGMKGSEYLDDLATDKRFLPFLDATTRFTIQGKVQLRNKEERGGYSTGGQVYQLFNESGTVLPYFLRNKVGVRMDWNNQLELLDTATGEKRTRALDRTNFQTIATSNPLAHKLRFGYQTLGHTVVLQLGHRVFGIDPLGKEPRLLWSKNLSLLPGSDTSPPGWVTNGLTVDPRDGSVQIIYTDGSMQRLGSSPLTAGVVCLARRDSLTAIDPVTGRELWVRTDVGSRSQIFGDDQHIYVVGIGEQGNANGTRVFRAHDGVSVKSRDFSDAFNNRVRIVGRNIVVKQVDAKGAPTLRIYDALQGKDVWKESFPVGSHVLDTEDPDLAGAVDATGAVRVVNVRTLKDVLNTKLDDPKHVSNTLSVGLLADPNFLFLAVNQNPDPNVVAPWGGGLQSNFMIGSGLRSMPVNGMVYAFNRQTGKRLWFNPVENQHVLLSEMEDMPALIFSARFQKLIGGGVGRTNIQAFHAQAIAKHNGKMWYKNDIVPMNMPFHAATVDHRTGTMELIGSMLKVTMYAETK